MFKGKLYEKCTQKCFLFMLLLLTTQFLIQVLYSLLQNGSESDVLNQNHCTAQDQVKACNFCLLR